MDLREQNFGIEIEFTGISRRKAADIVAGYFHVSSHYAGRTYDAYEVRDEQNRLWKLMSDSSIAAQRRISGSRQKISADSTYRVEFVSPICTYEDIPKIQQIIRDLRSAGAFVNDSCGIHVHVDASNHDVRTLRNLVNIMASKEDLFYKALDIKCSRERYCRKVDTNFLEKLNRRRPHSREQLSRLWYGDSSSHHGHYDRSRYHALNLHSVFHKGTVEFRMFNSTLHAGKIKTYIQFSLAISAQAVNQRKASALRTRSSNEKYTFRTWLLRLGMIGDEFRTARKFLLENLEGGIAWKDPAQAEAQKERLRAVRRAQDDETQTSQTQECEGQEGEEETSVMTMSM